jgi:hypothetical protein
MELATTALVAIVALLVGCAVAGSRIDLKMDELHLSAARVILTALRLVEVWSPYLVLLEACCSTAAVEALVIPALRSSPGAFPRPTSTHMHFLAQLTYPRRPHARQMATTQLEPS